LTSIYDLMITNKSSLTLMVSEIQYCNGLKTEILYIGYNFLMQLPDANVVYYHSN